MISAALHLAVLLIQGLMPASAAKTPFLPPVKVKYIPPEPAKKAKKPSTLIDAARPRKIEKSRTRELLASFDSRAHGSKPNRKAKKFQGTKTVVPKISGRKQASQNRTTTPRRKKTPPTLQPPPDTKELKFPLADRGFLTPQPAPAEGAPLAPREEAGTGSTLALLDGFDPAEYVNLDTGGDADLGDEEPISLDTSEVKYASYFARIKHQIERVWVYPAEAARRGQSGELTLRFQIQRDGNLQIVRLVEGSGSELLDFAAIRAIKNAAPFYPFPVTIEREKISILATFI
ncbi:MAG: energy transducer TonB, partial [Nitrospinaceae bacterium]